MTQNKPFKIFNMISNSPINSQSTQAQNEKVLSHLKSGKTINFIEARRMQIGFLNSRISQLKKANVPIASKFIKIGNTTCKEYWLATNPVYDD